MNAKIFGRGDYKYLVVNIFGMTKAFKEFMEELLVAAFNDALLKIEKESRQKLNDLTHHMQTKFSSDVTSA